MPFKGYKQTEEHKKKVSEAMKGKTPKNIKLIAGWNKGIKGHCANEKNGMWKGDDAKKGAIHHWIERRLGMAKEHKCIDCGKQAEDWANIDHKYRRNTNDYKALCKKCHRKFDIKYNNWKNINKNI